MRRIIPLLLISTLITACGGGDKRDVLILGYYPSSESEKIIEDLKPLEVYLEKRLGMDVKPFIATDYTSMVEGLCSGKIDASFLSPFPYVLGRKKCGIKMIIMSRREDGSIFYQSYFVVNSKSPYRSIYDLKGKVWGYPDITSTSGYLYPMLKFKKMGIDPDEWFPERVQLTSHENVVIAVYNGEVDFGTIYSDARKLLLREYPDVMDVVIKIDSIGPIPNDGVVVSPNLSPEIVEKLKEAFLEMPKDSTIYEKMKIYGWYGTAPAIDSLYDMVEEAARSAGVIR